MPKSRKQPQSEMMLGTHEKLIFSTIGTINYQYNWQHMSRNVSSRSIEDEYKLLSKWM